MKKKILLNGPKITNKNAFYGGGMGGVVRNMLIYLNEFHSTRFYLIPCYNTVRKKSRIYFFNFLWRLAFDVIKVIFLGSTASGIHIFGQYRTAVYREILISMVCRSIRIPMIYHIRAGNFVNWFESCSFFEKMLMKSILKSSKIILCEGLPYIDYIKDALDLEAYYLPNFVPSSEIPSTVEEKLIEKGIKVVFIGYCYEGKGVFELVEGCKVAAEKGLPIELTLVGEESPSFSRWMDSFVAPNSLCKINRLGRLDHTKVLKIYDQHDVFCMPTRHSGEGHNNSINEAMMMGMVIVSTRHGFLESVLGEKSSYFLENGDAHEISEMLLFIHNNRSDARKRVKNARARVMSYFSSDKAFEKLEEHYLNLTS